MAEFLLIHGSCHGAWCWRDVIPALETMGHTARAIDLPSHGDDPTPLADVTLEGCRDAVLAASTPDTVIVGHSWGGYPISAAAEAAPDAMRGLIYLAAYVPVSGQSLAQMRRSSPGPTIVDSIVKSADGLSYTIAPDDIRTLFHHDCPVEAVTYALPRLCPQAIAPQETPLEIGARFASVPKAYIRTTEDRTIATEFQATMCRDFPADRHLTLGSAHSPFFSHPTELARMLGQIAQDF